MGEVLKLVPQRGYGDMVLFALLLIDTVALVMVEVDHGEVGG